MTINKRIILPTFIAAAVLGAVFVSMLPPAYGSEARAQGFDVVHYDIALEIHPEESSVEGTAILYVKRSEANARSIVLKLEKSLDVIEVSITAYPEKPAFERKDDELVVFLPDELKEGAASDEYSIKIKYAGGLRARKDGRSWSYVGKDSAYAVYEAYWYPQKPGDRATGTIKIIAPEGWKAVSNGELASTAESFVWQDNFQEVGFSFAASKYEEVQGLNGHVEVKCYLITRINNCDELLKDILLFMESKLGKYPYQKLALAEVKDSLNGGHGDQTLIIMSSDIIKSDGKFLEFLAHETAHNWFGDLVTVKEFNERKNLFLLEATATYFSTLYLETKDKARARKSLENMRREYMYARKNLGDESIAETREDYGSIFHAVAYSKGAWVLHMLRYTVGEENFYKIFREYFARYTWKDASIEDFESLAQEVSGQNLTWFFDEWLHKAVLPDFEISGAEIKKLDDGTYSLELSIEQKGELIEMPAEIYIKTRNGEEIARRVNIKNREENVNFLLKEKPVFAEIDRGNFILEEKKTNNRKILSYGLNKDTINLVGYVLKERLRENLMLY